MGRHIRQCPKCGAEPFDQFLPRQVVRDWWPLKSWFVWYFLNRELTRFAVICRGCKEIVGYE